MKTLEPTPGRLWWAKPPTTLLYLIREINGILLGILALAIIVHIIIFIWFSTPLYDLGLKDPYEFFTLILIWMFFASSCVHSVTWFIALPKIIPIELSPQLQKAATLIIIVIWLIISWLIIHYLFIK